MMNKVVFGSALSKDEIEARISNLSNQKPMREYLLLKQALSHRHKPNIKKKIIRMLTPKDELDELFVYSTKQIFEGVGEGARITVYKKLCGLEAEGVVERDYHKTACFWKLVSRTPKEES